MRDFRRERSGKPSRLLLVLFTILIITSAVTGTARAANGDPVDTIANPAGTTITLFDYWIYDNNGRNTASYYPYGINQGHDLLFRGTGNNAPGAWNIWTGSGAGAYQGIVQNVLGTDGYPVLAVGTQAESLAYLFNPDNIDINNQPVKRVYPIGEMFTVESDGHYSFNSTIHKGVLNPDGTLSVTEQTNGQFFPFGTPTNTNPTGWFFGAHINSEFSIPYDHMVLNPSGEYQEMVFNFTGDDDVWVFIDGILIGDAGGIHDTQDLDINFTTGDVLVKNTANGSNRHETTIYKMVVAAIGEEEAQRRFLWKEEPDGSYKTFAGNTYHTLDFFYLERGGNLSNMEMRYNLVSTYHFSAHKALHRANSQSEQVLQENQFRYKLSGYPITDENYPITDVSGQTVRIEAVMPKEQPDPDVIWIPNYDHTKPLTEDNVAQEPFVKTLIVGNSADGNINFGNTDLHGAQDDPDSEFSRYMGKTFRYVCEELPPVGAELNPDGITYTYKGEIISPDENGYYMFDGIVYDKTVYYFEATVAPEGWVNKRYYTDDTYTNRAHVSFSNFDNMYNSVGRANLAGNKKYQTESGIPVPLDARQFSLKLTNITDPANPKVVQQEAFNDGDGTVAFDQIRYTLEKDIPSGQSTAVFTYKIEENPGTSASITYSDAVYYARVTVTDIGGGVLTTQVKYYSDPQFQTEVEQAAVIFTNEVTSLSIDKTVAGNIGSKNRNFSFTLNMPEMAGKRVKYSTDGGRTLNEIVFDDNGQTAFTLRHLDKIIFYEVAGSFTVTETNPGDYTVTWATDDNSTSNTPEATGTVPEIKEVSYTDTLDVNPPTGIRDQITAALTGIAAAFLLLLITQIGKGRKKNG